MDREDIIYLVGGLRKRGEKPAGNKMSGRSALFNCARGRL